MNRLLFGRLCSNKTNRSFLYVTSMLFGRLCSNKNNRSFCLLFGCLCVRCLSPPPSSLPPPPALLPHPAKLTPSFNPPKAERIPVVHGTVQGLSTEGDYQAKYHPGKRLCLPSLNLRRIMYYNNNNNNKEDF